jgi:integrase
MAGQLIKRGSGKWLLRIYKGRDAVTGARRYSSMPFSGDQNQARAELDRFIKQHAGGFKLRDPEMTVARHVERWLDLVASNKYAPTTVKNYKGILNYDLIPILGHIKLSEIKPDHIQKVLNTMRNRGVASNTRRRMYSVLSTIFHSAVEWELIEENPVVHIQMPRRERKEMRSLNLEESKRLIAEADKTKWGPLILTAIVLGTRPGETFGLRWNDVDFKNNLVSIQRTLTWIGKVSEGWELRPLKRETARRQIVISHSLKHALLKHKQQQDLRRERLGARYKDNGLVFARWGGEPIYRSKWVICVFKPLLNLAGLPHSIRFYDLRHTSATLLLKAGEHIKVVSERLGHSNIAITLEIYAHVLPTMQAGAATKMEKMFPDNGTLEAHQPAHNEEEEES